MISMNLGTYATLIKIFDFISISNIHRHFLITWLVLLFSLFPNHAKAADEEVSYHKHIMALFSKLSCNGGNCHGAVKGQNGFRLSMFSADPQGDHARLLYETGGRRVNPQDPASSLLLLKATGQIPHGGDVRMHLGGADYQMFLRWLALGAQKDDINMAQLSSLQVTPAEQLTKPGEKYRLKVQAKFANGKSEDVTDLCSFESLDPGVATIDRQGWVEGVGVGDAGLIVRYRAQPIAARVLVPKIHGIPFPNLQTAHFIDRHVVEKLKLLNLPPADLCDDATFFRRIHIDMLGDLPSPEEVRNFLQDKQPDKRTKKIEQLLVHPSHADLWTLKFCDLLKAAEFGVYADALSKEQDAPRMQAWIHSRLVENIPYDQFAERILLANSREGRSIEEYIREVTALFEGYAPGRPDLEVYSKRKTLDLYWQRRNSSGVKGTLQVAHAFLGLRLECAQCHRHPHDNWQQEDLLDFANLFMRVRNVGFEGDNEKKFPDIAVHFKKLNTESKTLESEVKKRKEGEGKKQDELGKKYKLESEKLTSEVAKLEKSNPSDPELSKKKEELKRTKDGLETVEKYRQETATLEKKSKLLNGISVRMMHAESRLLPEGTFAKVTSPLGTAESKKSRLLGKTEAVSVPAESDPRVSVIAWMREPTNPYFAKAIVNRVWAHYFGRGIIDPPDNLSAFNPATHPELLEELCAGFIKNNYDLRWLHRTIISSRTYQQSSTPKPGSETDRTHYASFTLRRMQAEILLDAINTATSTNENMDMKFSNWPDSMKIVQMPFFPRNTFVTHVLETYGKPQRNGGVQCDCERDESSSIFQVLTIANHPRIWEKIKDPKGRLAKLLKESLDDSQKIEELFLATLSRTPNENERTHCLEYIKAASSSEKGYQGVFWSLLNTREFLLQH